MRITTEEVQSAVSRAAVDYDVLPVGVVLAEYAFNRLFQCNNAIKCGRYDGDLQRIGHGLYFLVYNKSYSCATSLVFCGTEQFAAVMSRSGMVDAPTRAGKRR